MELRQLEYFVAVTEERGFTRAAARLHVVQSAVSAGVKALETELGTALFHRGSRHVELTDAGEVLLPRARAALDAVAAAEDAVADVRGGLRGSVRIGTLTSIRLVHLPALLGRFHRDHPEVRLLTTADSSGSQGLLEKIIDRRLDLAFVSLPSGVPSSVTITHLDSARLALAVPREHPLARRESVRLEEIADLDFIDSPLGYGNRTVTDRAFVAAGLQRRITAEVADVATGADFVRHGLGVSLLPGFVLESMHDLAAVPVEGATLEWPLSLATPADRQLGAAAQAFVDLVLGSTDR